MIGSKTIGLIMFWVENEGVGSSFERSLLGKSRPEADAFMVGTISKETLKAEESSLMTLFRRQRDTEAVGVVALWQCPRQANTTRT